MNESKSIEEFLKNYEIKLTGSQIAQKNKLNQKSAANALNVFEDFADTHHAIRFKLGGANYYHVAKGGEWWRLVCPIFLHFSLIHILFNCYVIRFAGQIAESAYGSAKFFCMYLVTGVAGALVSLVWYKIGLGAGASGAAFGIIGMAGVYGIRRRDEGLRRMMFQWAFIAFAFGLFSPGIDNAAHLGGLAMGVALGFMVKPAERTRLSTSAVRLWDVLAVMGIGLVVLSFAFAILNGGLIPTS